MPSAGNDLRKASKLICHWNQSDLPAVIQTITELETRDDLQDMIAALLILRAVPDEKLSLIGNP
jgi:hypothetical protein